MPGRGPQTFKKRQKEQQRKERQQEKFAKRLQRRQERENSPNTAPDSPFIEDPEELGPSTAESEWARDDHTARDDRTV
jgi:hypothetical protein